MSKFNFQGKTALVTGANRGLGEAFVRQLISNGVTKVYTAVRDLNNLEILKDAFSDKIHPILLDVTNSSNIAAMPAQIEKLDILVNNAGIAHGCFSTANEAIEIARLEMDTNYFGPMQITHALLPILKKSSEAAIINISSIAGISGLPVIGPYSASKAAMHSFTEVLRADLQNDPISVIGVYPGPIDTRMAAEWEMEKPSPIQIAQNALKVLAAGEFDVFPDDFSKEMYKLFLEHPHKLQEAFAQMQ